jgi:hypothetical protein
MAGGDPRFARATSLFRDRVGAHHVLARDYPDLACSSLPHIRKAVMRISPSASLARFLGLATVVFIAGMLAPVASATGAGAERATPPGRFYAGIAFDAARNQVVMFGGHGETSALNDTWTWDGTSWTKRMPAHRPRARVGMGMAYDALTSQVILFGGVDKTGTVLGDTWAWDGADWTKLHPTDAPSPRDGNGLRRGSGSGRLAGWSRRPPGHVVVGRLGLDGTCAPAQTVCTIRDGDGI